MRIISIVVTLRGEGLSFCSVNIEDIFVMDSFNHEVPLEAGLSWSFSTFSYL